MKKIIVLSVIVLFFIMIVFSSGTFSSSTKSDMYNLKNERKKIFYPIVKFEWNIHETRLEWINSGFFRGLFSLDEISYSFSGENGFEFDISLVFWSKYKIDYGTVHVDPLLRPKIELVSGDTISWNLLLYNEDMNGKDVWSRYAFGVWIETAS